MCGRFTLTTATIDEVAAFLGATPDPQARETYRPRYNVAPTDRHIILCEKGERRLVPAAWGFGEKKPLINARAESADKRPTFRGAFLRNRCIVPADGFFEWTAEGQPIWFHPKDGGLLLMAGLYEAGPGPGELRFTILTTEANGLVAPIHDRMPAILLPSEIHEWLTTRDPKRAQALLRPLSDALLVSQEVSTRVSSVKNDDPECLTPPEKKTPRQLRLLD